MVIFAPASVTGRGKPARLPSEAARFDPKTETIVPGASSVADAKLAALTTRQHQLLRSACDTWRKSLGFRRRSAGDDERHVYVRRRRSVLREHRNRSRVDAGREALGIGVDLQRTGGRKRQRVWIHAQPS